MASMITTFGPVGGDGRSAGDANDWPDIASESERAIVCGVSQRPRRFHRDGLFRLVADVL